MIPPSDEQHELAYAAQRAVVVEVGGGLRTYDGVLDGYRTVEPGETFAGVWGISPA